VAPAGSHQPWVQTFRLQVFSGPSCAESANPGGKHRARGTHSSRDVNGPKDRRGDRGWLTRVRGTGWIANGAERVRRQKHAPGASPSGLWRRGALAEPLSLTMESRLEHQRGAGLSQEAQVLLGCGHVCCAMPGRGSSRREDVTPRVCRILPRGTPSAQQIGVGRARSSDRHDVRRSLRIGGIQTVRGVSHRGASDSCQWPACSEVGSWSRSRLETRSGRPVRVRRHSLTRVSPRAAGSGDGGTSGSRSSHPLRKRRFGRVLEG